LARRRESNKTQPRPQKHVMKTKAERADYFQNVINSPSAGETVPVPTSVQAQTAEVAVLEGTPDIAAAATRKRVPLPDTEGRINWVSIIKWGIVPLILFVFFLATLDNKTRQNSEDLREIASDIKDHRETAVGLAQRLASLEVHAKLWQDGSKEASRVVDEIKRLRTKLEDLEKNDLAGTQVELASIQKRVAALELQIQTHRNNGEAQ